MNGGKKENRTMHWSQINRDPLASTSSNYVRANLRDRYLGRITNYDDLWNTYVQGRDVLDIGVVEHQIDYVNREGWKHRRLKNLAKRIVGIDILKEEVATLSKMGFDVHVVDATSDADIGERFDVVYIGDVIEHVNDPVKLLRFAARHMRPSGLTIVTTPCPWWWKHLAKVVHHGSFIENVDHITWITPSNALEIINRAGLTLHGYFTAEALGSNAIKRALHRLRIRLFGNNEIFAWAYVFLITRSVDKAADSK